MLAKADPLNAASCLLAAFLAGYRSTRGVSLLEPDASRFAAGPRYPGLRWLPRQKPLANGSGAPAPTASAAASSQGLAPFPSDGTGRKCTAIFNEGELNASQSTLALNSFAKSGRVWMIGKNSMLSAGAGRTKKAPGSLRRPLVRL